jgi:hypothetical protein
VLDLELDLVLNLFVVLVTVLQLKVHEQAVVVVEPEQLLLLRLVPGQLLLEVG